MRKNVDSVFYISLEILFLILWVIHLWVLIINDFVKGKKREISTVTPFTFLLQQLMFQVPDLITADG